MPPGYSSTKPATNVYPLLGEPQNIQPISRLTSPTCLLPQRLGCALSSVCLVHAPSPSLQSLKMQPQPTLLLRRLNVSILCSLLNLASPTPGSLYLPYPLTPNCSWTPPFSLEKMEKFLVALSSISAMGPGGISAHVNLNHCAEIFFVVVQFSCKTSP